MERKLIRDYVDVKAHPTVVRLADLNQAGSEWITHSFFLSEQVSGYLNILTRLLSERTGKGMFLIGHYGSGKSHFLAYICQQLSSGKWGPHGPNVFPVSLLNHKAVSSLEHVVESALGIGNESRSRAQIWEDGLRKFPNGIFLIIDELSEFLKSKPSAQSFNEDIRFLQFLAEWGVDRPVWILAALQEQIEHTGLIEDEIYRKIKDRYPIRFILSPTHVKDLIGQHLLIKKDGFQTEVEKWFRKIQQCFPDLKVDFSDFALTYPLHPATLEILDEIRDRFSQARGIVEFTLSELLGNPVTGSEPFLDRPFGELLTPDVIVRHFQDLFELQPEFQELSQKLLPFYRKQLPVICQNDKTEQLAWKLLHLLILTHISPQRGKLTTEEAAAWLLVRISSIDARKNEQAIRSQLDRLVTEGAYIQRTSQGYCLNLADDSHRMFDRLLEKTVLEMAGHEQSSFQLISPLLDSMPFNPMSLKQGQWEQLAARWHFHDRQIGVFIGNETPEGKPPDCEVAFRVALPWGNTPEAHEYPVVRATQIEPTRDIVELAALMKLRDRPLPQPTKKRVEDALQTRKSIFQKEVLRAYEDSVLQYPDGYQERIAGVDSRDSFRKFLGLCGIRLLQKKFPQFEKFAPIYGPVPMEAYRQFAEFLQEHSVEDEEAPQFVELIRESYLVPLKILQRKGKGYRLPASLNGHELVSMIHKVVPYHPSPRKLYDHFADPVYGLVPDQVHLLLLVLYFTGDIEIASGRVSYRVSFRTLPLPIQYETLSPGKMLTTQQINCLEKLCRGLGIDTPSHWTVSSEKQATGKLRSLASKQKDMLLAFTMRLQQQPNIGDLQSEIAKLVNIWSALDKEDSGLEQFLYEVGSPGSFISLHQKLSALPQRFDVLWRDCERMSHLLAHPQACTCILDELEGAPKEPPSVCEPESLQCWLDKAREYYSGYQKRYAEKHAQWWMAINQNEPWRPPRVAESPHVGTEEFYGRWRSLSSALDRQRCRTMSSLDYQPRCTCGFDGVSSPIQATIKEMNDVRTEIETNLKLFFDQLSVRETLTKWMADDPPASESDWRAVKAYLNRETPYPDIRDIELLGKQLAGVRTYQVVEVPRVTSFLVGKTWTKSALLDAFRQFLSGFGDRIKFQENAPGDATALLKWAAKQSVKHGISLPGVLSATECDAIADCLESGWVSPKSLAHLEKLGLCEQAVDKILAWCLSQTLSLPGKAQLNTSELMTLVYHCLNPGNIAGIEEWKAVVEMAFRHHTRLLRLSTKVWLQFMNRLAEFKPEPGIRPLNAFVKNELDSQWIVLDGMGVAAMPMVIRTLGEAARDWTIKKIDYALAPSTSDTSSFYAELTETGVNKEFHKINAIDRILHDSTPGEAVLPRLKGELDVALRRGLERMDRSRKVLLFSDHGFRIHTNGLSFCHGGDSTIERLVPVLTLQVSDDENMGT